MLGGAVLTLAVTWVGWYVFASIALGADEGEGAFYAFVIWMVVVPLVIGPMLIWATLTFAWRRLPGPGRAVRATSALVLLAPGVATASFGAETWGPGRTDLDTAVVVTCAAVAVVAGALLTARTVRSRTAAGIVAAAVVIGVAGVTFAAGSADRRYEAGIRDEVTEWALPVALPAAGSGWEATSWSFEYDAGPGGESDAPPPRFVRLVLVGPGRQQVGVEFRGPSAPPCAGQPCARTEQAVDGIGLQYVQARGVIVWVLPRAGGTWVLPDAGHLVLAEVLDVLSALEPVSVDRWADAVAPLPPS